MNMISSFLITIVLSALQCQPFVESLAAPINTATSTPSNRVFVAGISHDCTARKIRSTFSPFGAVRDVLIIGQDDATRKRNRLPYCFVTFETASSAQRAIAAPAPALGGYKEVQYARPKDDSRTRSNRSRAQETERVTQITAFGRETNLIVQVQTTHLERLVDYLYLHRQDNKKQDTSDGNGPDRICRVVGSTGANNSRNVSLLFLSCADPTSLARDMFRNPLLARCINKSYIVKPSELVRGNLATERGCDAFANLLFDKISSVEQNMALRLQVFPPTHQSRLLRSFDRILSDATKNASRQPTIDPKRFNHMLSIVEVYQDKGRGWERRQQDEDNKLYMTGVSPASLELDVVDTNNIIADADGGDSDCVNRAYYKLKEAIAAYEASHGKFNQDLCGAIALDCGSAPGGWTKYLIEHVGCQKVYSVDPGELSPSVSKLKETRHMKMKIQEAMPILLENAAAEGRLNIFVSDMCLHDMEDQANMLLAAKRKGLLAPRALFVLTLKCVVGRSKLSYDSQVARVVAGLCATGNVQDVETFHLFSNRSGERTVVGRLD